jgi:hypothetical protein
MYIALNEYDCIYIYSEGKNTNIIKKSNVYNLFILLIWTFFR